MIRKTVPIIATALALPLLAGCGGGGSSPTPSPAPTATLTSTPTPIPTATPTPTVPDFSAVSTVVDAYSDENFAVLIGDTSGILYSRTKGTFGLDEQFAIASASKWFTATTIMRLVDRGVMSLDDNPQDHLTYWTSDPMDPRSQVTLAQLLSFTSGFSDPIAGNACTSAFTGSMQNCVRNIYDDGLTATPGTVYYYGNEHMHIAAAMAEVATGTGFAELLVNETADPLGLSSATRFTFPTQANPLAAGGLSSSARDTGTFLTALLADNLIADRASFLADRTTSVTFGFRPGETRGTRDWHYALGAWVECDKPVFDDECAAQQIYSSPGSFGWTPWVDLQNGYWGLIARRGELNSAAVAVELEQQLQPLIVAALAP